MEFRVGDVAVDSTQLLRLNRFSPSCTPRPSSLPTNMLNLVPNLKTMEGEPVAESVRQSLVNDLAETRVH